MDNKDFSKENFETLQKEIEEATGWWKDLLGFLFGKTDILKIAESLKNRNFIHL